MIVKLYSNCIPVKGFKTSIICDLQNNKIFTIPNDLYSILTSKKNLSIKKIKSSYDNEYDEIIDEYFKYLFDAKLAFKLGKNEADGFLPLNLKWLEPTQVYNAIFDYNKESHYNILIGIDQINNIGCKHLLIRLFCEIKLSLIKKILDHLDSIKSSILSIDFVLKFESHDYVLKIIELINSNDRVLNFTFYGSNLGDYHEYFSKGDSRVFFSNQDILSCLQCGFISYGYFSPNVNTFSESTSYNSCLNGKISIDVNGEIKNCPSMTQSFGNIKDIAVEDALEYSEFKKYWKITKDQIEICKDCEFRYVCTDCRAYTERTHFEGKIDLSKPLKCGYNPYTSEWEEWSTNPLKQQAIEHYGMQELNKIND